MEHSLLNCIFSLIIFFIFNCHIPIFRQEVLDISVQIIGDEVVGIMNIGHIDQLNRVIHSIRQESDHSPFLFISRIERNISSQLRAI